MADGLQIDRASIEDNDVVRQVEFVGEVDGEEHDFAIRYAVLKELSGDEPDGDALEIFERHADEIAELCADALERRPASAVVVVDADDME